MLRRQFFKTAMAGSAVALGGRSPLHAATPKMKITRVKYYQSPDSRPIFNQSRHIVTVETDAGLTGIGEGGAKDTIEQCAGVLIGQDPSRIEHLWQLMFRNSFYPAGREKLHAVGALDMALWDIKGKALGMPVHQLLGGLTRDYCECYSTGFPRRGTISETARACMEAGFRAFRTGVTGASDAAFDSRDAVRRTYLNSVQAREGVGKKGDWTLDYHTKLDMPDAVRLSSLIEGLEPYLAEDLVRSENPEVYKVLRQQVRVPIAVGEQFGARWDTNTLIEQHLIDYTRVTLPNVGGITEFRKIAALCETHYVGLVPHFSGPISEAALVHVCGVFPGPALLEIVGDKPKEEPHLPQHADFSKGRFIPNDRPGLGVEFDPKRVQLISEIKEPAEIRILHRPDGSLTNR